MIVTQTPPPKKHDRTGDFVPRSKFTQELSAMINDGLFYYEQVQCVCCVIVYNAVVDYFLTRCIIDLRMLFVYFCDVCYVLSIYHLICRIYGMIVMSAI